MELRPRFSLQQLSQKDFQENSLNFQKKTDLERSCSSSFCFTLIRQVFLDDDDNEPLLQWD
jgi:hypothetical protein